MTVSPALSVSEFHAFVGTSDDGKAALAAIRPDLLGSIERTLDVFYDKLRAMPTMRHLLGDDDIARLKTQQRQHWGELLSPVLPESYAERARVIGVAHERIGLEPGPYVAGYGLVMGELLKGLAAKHDPATAHLIAGLAGFFNLILLDIQASTSAYLLAREDSTIARQLVAMSEHLDTEMSTSLNTTLAANAEMRAAAERMKAAMGETREAASRIASVAESATSNVQSVAAAAEELSASTQEIGGLVVRSSTAANSAVAVAAQANATMNTLADASKKIEAVVGIINQISGQTRLLALNATIEAARAGEAGRGFQVVASEVKSLADQTGKSTSEIREQVQAIQQATKAAVDALSRVGNVIRDIEAISQQVSGAVGAQVAATSEISRSAQAAAGNSAEVTREMGQVARRTAETGTLSEHVATTVEGSSQQLEELQRRLTVLLRTSGAGNRRAATRFSISEPGRLVLAGGSASGTVDNVSQTGALFLAPDVRTTMGERVDLVLPRIGEMSCRVVTVAPYGVHLTFDRLSSAVAERHAAYLAELEAEQRPFIAATTGAARKVTAAFEQALSRGEISMEALFDERYRPVEGSNPPQVTTRFTDFCDRVLPAIQDPLTSLDHRVVFCVAVDRNGYLPTHQPQYSRPPGRDPVWNAANCRNRRIFDDPNGLADARNTNELLMQTYNRDMGGGRVERMRSISAPIWIRNRHWGALRLAMKVA